MPTSTNQSDQLRLTSYQEKKLEAINETYSSTVKDLRAEYTTRSQELTKLIADPKASEESIRQVVHAISDMQAEAQLASILAQRARNKVYTPHQRELVTKPAGSSCGCGGSSTQARATTEVAKQAN